MCIATSFSCDMYNCYIQPSSETCFNCCFLLLKHLSFFWNMYCYVTYFVWNMLCYICSLLKHILLSPSETWVVTSFFWHIYWYILLLKQVLLHISSENRSVTDILLPKQVLLRPSSEHNYCYFPLLKHALLIITVTKLLAFVSTALNSYHWRELPQVAFLSRQAYFCRDKRRVLSRQTRVCCDKSIPVETKRLSRQTELCRDKYLSWQTFCRNKNILLRQTIFSRQNVCHDKHTFVTTKDVFVARKKKKKDAKDRPCTFLCPLSDISPWTPESRNSRQPANTQRLPCFQLEHCLQHSHGLSHLPRGPDWGQRRHAGQVTSCCWGRCAYRVVVVDRSIIKVISNNNNAIRQLAIYPPKSQKHYFFSWSMHKHTHTHTHARPGITAPVDWA